VSGTFRQFDRLNWPELNPLANFHSGLKKAKLSMAALHIAVAKRCDLLRSMPICPITKPLAFRESICAVHTGQGSCAIPRDSARELLRWNARSGNPGFRCFFPTLSVLMAGVCRLLRKRIQLGFEIPIAIDYKNRCSDWILFGSAKGSNGFLSEQAVESKPVLAEQSRKTP
jgi:hypothetical protein